MTMRAGKRRKPRRQLSSCNHPVQGRHPLVQHGLDRRLFAAPSTGPVKRLADLQRAYPSGHVALMIRPVGGLTNNGALRLREAPRAPHPPPYRTSDNETQTPASAPPVQGLIKASPVQGPIKASPPAEHFLSACSLMRPHCSECPFPSPRLKGAGHSTSRPVSYTHLTLPTKA